MSDKIYEVEIDPRAIKDSRKIPKMHRARIAKALRSLARDPRHPGTKRMRGPFRGLYRIRVGDYRVVYSIEDDRLLVLVIRMGSRQYIYQALLRFLATLT